MNPILIDIPVPIMTPRLMLRPAQAGDGVHVNQAIRESFAELNKWMKWADTLPTVEESEATMRTMEAKWIMREELMLLIFDRATQTFLGGTGYHTIDWKIPSFEIGYWIRTSYAGRGLITESTQALVVYAFEQLHAARVAITCDENNVPSRRVAEKLLFKLEGVHKNSRRTPDGILSNTVIYARYDCKDLFQ